MEYVLFKKKKEKKRVCNEKLPFSFIIKDKWNTNKKVMFSFNQTININYVK